jgi:hypothetical protein
MTPDELQAFMRMAVTIDARVEVTDLAAETWDLTIGDLDARDAAEALVAHYRESTDRVMPAHIRTRVRAARAARAAAVPGAEVLMADLDALRPQGVTAADYARLFRARRDAMIDGRLALPDAIRRYPATVAVSAATETDGGQ